MFDFEEAVALGKNQANDGGRPEFYIEPVDFKDTDGNVKSRDEVYVRIFNIADPKNIIVRPKRDEDEKRWPQYWKAYLDNTEVPTDGTPLESFPHFTPADILNLRRRKIRTVEEVVGLPDPEIQKILGGKAFATRKKAQQFLDYRQGDTAELLKRIEELEKQLGDNTDNVPERADGDGVPESIDAGGEQQSGRKNNPGARKKKRKKASRRASVGSADEGA